MLRFTLLAGSVYMEQWKQQPVANASVSEDAFVRTMSCRTMLKAYILAIVKDAHLAEDTFQDTVLIIARSWSSYDCSQPFEPWARKIARNRALNNLRKFKRPTVELDDEVIDALGCAFDRLSSDRNLEVDKQALSNCLDQLSEKNQSLIRKRYYENVPYAELTRIFGRSANTLYVTFARLHSALERCMKQARAT